MKQERQQRLDTAVEAMRQSLLFPMLAVRKIVAEEAADRLGISIEEAAGQLDSELSTIKPQPDTLAEYAALVDIAMCDLQEFVETKL